MYTDPRFPLSGMAAQDWLRDGCSGLAAGVSTASQDMAF